QRKSLGHNIDLNVEKHRLFLQKLVLIAQEKLDKNIKENPLLISEYGKIIDELEEIKKLAFGYARWMKIKKVSIVKNKGIKWVYDVTIEPYNTFISNNMILHNTITISKANVQATLRAETSVLAAANPKFGRFDPYQSIAQQIDLPPTLINRFDIIFTLRDIPDKDKDERIATHVLSEHQKQGEDMFIPRELFRKYVAYAKQRIKPSLSSEAVNEIKKFYIDLRNRPVSSESALRPIPISARQLQALIRMAEASAKLRLSNTVSPQDAKEAIEIMKFYLMQVGYDYESKTFDIDKITTGIPTSQRSKIIVVRETISELENRLGKLIPIEELEKELENKLSKDEIQDALTKLNSSGDIFHPRRGFVQRT
ncbi:MAG: DNA replication protein, partial [Candidatus Nanoarchaeia archaeon]